MTVKTNDNGLSTFDYELLEVMLSRASKDNKYKTIVDAPFANKLYMALLFLGFICLYVVVEDKKEIQLKAASGTEEYSKAVERYNFKLASFHLYFDKDKGNTIVRAVASKKPLTTTDWITLSRKNKSPELVRVNQANSGIAYTAVYPFKSKVRGALMFNFYQYPDQIDDKQRAFMKKYTDIVSDYLSSES